MFWPAAAVERGCLDRIPRRCRRKGTTGLPYADLIKGATVITGVHDLEPVLHISVNREVRLDRQAARRLGPIHHPPVHPTPVVVAVGGAESEAWIKQSRDYACACQAAGCPTDYLEIPGANHFSITGSLGDGAGALHRAMRAQMGLLPDIDNPK